MSKIRHSCSIGSVAAVSLALAIMVSAVFGVGDCYAAQEDASLHGMASSAVSYGQIFEETDDIDDCQFVMMDYDVGIGDVVYLKVRSGYSAWYAGLDSNAAPGIPLDTPEGDGPETVFTDHPLSRIQGTGNAPWKDLLMLVGENDSTVSYGTAFLTDDNVALTCGHCVMDHGEFFWHLTAYSSPDTLGSEDRHEDVSKAIVPVEWYSPSNGVNSHEYGYAVLVFDDHVPGSSDHGLFNISSNGGSIDLNCAGWLENWDGTDGWFAWRNAYTGSISWLMSSGNLLAVNLSALPGMSGGPLYWVDDDGSTAVGIMAGESLDSPYWNYATAISERCKCVVSWAGASGFDSIYPGGGSSPFTGPSDDAHITALQASCQKRLQSTAPNAIPAALGRAMRLNPDVFAWLYVPGTGVSLPVARRAGDDSYYLSHDSFGNESPIGCAYVAGEAAPDLSDAVTAAYGHSFSSGGLAFTSLHAFEDAAFFASHDEAYVYLPGRRLEYRVVGAYLYTDKGIGTLDQSDPGELAAYFAMLSEEGPSTFVGYKRRGALEPGSDRVLQLSTCTVPADPSLRMVVTCAYVGEEAV